jgi:hypothetical protein
VTLLRRSVWTPLVGVGMVSVLLSQSGCAGLVAVVRGSSAFQLERPVLVSGSVLSSDHRGPPPSVDHLLTGFGEPDEVIASGTHREQWRYRTGVRFHGLALLLVVIPLPLLVPTGVHDTYVEIEHGSVVRVRGSRNWNLARIGCMIGAIAALSGDEGCFAGRGSPPSQASLGSGRLWLGPPPNLEKALPAPHRSPSP